MDEDQFVAIHTVAGFNQIKKLTTDIKLIVEAIKSIKLFEWSFLLLTCPLLQIRHVYK